MKFAVARHERGALRARQLAEGAIESVGGQVGIEFGEGVAEALREDNF